MEMMIRGVVDYGVINALKTIQLSGASGRKADAGGSDPAFRRKAGATNGIFPNPGTEIRSLDCAICCLG
ncbi:uncharacterized [Tachysurus ichikawai]